MIDMLNNVLDIKFWILLEQSPFVILNDAVYVQISGSSIICNGSVLYNTFNKLFNIFSKIKNENLVFKPTLKLRKICEWTIVNWYIYKYGSKNLRKKFKCGTKNVYGSNVTIAAFALMILL